MMVGLWIMIGILVVGLVFLIIIANRQSVDLEGKQAELDYQIGLAIDRGDHAEADRLREQKIELMLYGP